MKLTLFTDYSLRVLLYLAAEPDRLCSIAEVARAYGISHNHLMKVANQLARSGYIESMRGRSGGIRLGKPAETINIGTLVRHTEDSFALVDCGSCAIAPACGMTSVLKEAMAAFLAVLDRYTLADLMSRGTDFSLLFGGPFEPRGETSESARASGIDEIADHHSDHSDNNTPCQNIAY